VTAGKINVTGSALQRAAIIHYLIKRRKQRQAQQHGG